jgi:hypothetical protein
MLVGLDLGYWWLRQALTEVVANMGVLPVALLCESGPCPRLQDGSSLLPLLGWYQNTPPLPILVMGRSKEFLRRITFWRNKDDGLWGEDEVGQLHPRGILALRQKCFCIKWLHYRNSRSYLLFSA